MHIRERGLFGKTYYLGAEEAARLTTDLDVRKQIPDPKVLLQKAGDGWKLVVPVVCGNSFRRRLLAVHAEILFFPWQGEDLVPQAR